MSWHEWKTKHGERILSHTFVIDGLPISQKNSRPIHRRADGTPFIGTATNVRQWKTNARLQLHQQWKCQHPIADAEVRAHIVIYQGKGQALDADNAIAGAFDALQKAKVIRNDYQLACGSWDRQRDRERPRIEITLTPVGDPPGKETGNGKRKTKTRNRVGRKPARPEPRNTTTKAMHPPSRRPARRVW